MDGKLDLLFGKRKNKTIMKDVYYQPPLKASRGLYVKNASDLTVYLMESSGGLVAGDSNEYNVQLEEGSTITLHPQAATKVYPSFNGRPSSQKVSIELADRASLSWKTEEVIPFANSSFQSHTKVDMKRNSRFYWEEILYPGREKRGESFTFESCQTMLEVWMEEQCLVYDRIHFDPNIQSIQHQGVMGNFQYVASIWIIDHQLKIDPEHWNQSSADHQVSVTSLRDIGYLVRFLSNDLPRIKNEMASISQYVESK
ncbi:urease accessory protein UreD [Gracilibacillus massiliensis]|uniref:urease accessory protein UreD n=1 Tax=Gracilibacillus massiliensis TaxID=1564956 RepID=UPI00071D0BDB|nr:urease accessory protein UreD [Gracilibacillus massiliensis]